MNYDARRMAPVTIKIVLSFLLFLIGGGAFLWRILDPSIVRSLTGPSVLYLALNFLLLPVIALLGWYGATLTFPMNRKPVQHRHNEH
jgi:hypothetical protein